MHLVQWQAQNKDKLIMTTYSDPKHSDIDQSRRIWKRDMDLLKAFRRINRWRDQIFCYLQLTLLILNFRPKHTSLTELQTLPSFKLSLSIKCPLLAILTPKIKSNAAGVHKTIYVYLGNVTLKFMQRCKL